MVSALATFFAGLSLVLIGGIAGVFFAYSVSVMRGLDGIRPEYAVPAMQSINRKILNPVFLSAFVLAPVAAVIAGGLMLALGRTGAAVAFFAATAAVNVPLNAALDAAGPPSDARAAEQLWSAFSGRWTRWNTIRTVISSVSLLLVGAALFAWGRDD